MKEIDEVELARAEEQASHAERELVDAIAEAEADAAEVARVLSDLRARVAGHRERGVVGLDAVHEELDRLASPRVPLDRHHARVRDARADAVRARTWVVTAMRDDLARFALELGDVVEVADRARAALDRLRSGERVEPSRRLERLRTGTAELVALPAAHAPGLAASARRQLPRIRLETSIDMHSASNFFTGLSENISDGGVFVATDRDAPIGTEVELAFTLPDGVEIRGRGQVRWARRRRDGVVAGLGVQFIDLSGAAQDAVQNFVRVRSPIIHPA